MIRPAIELQETHNCLYFVANLHSLTTVRDPNQMRMDTKILCATFLASGLDPSRSAFFRHSDIPEVTELAWYLACCVSFGDLTRAHAFKAAKDKGEEGAMNLGTFSYPVLMAADILAYDSDVVPVGKDQVQHVEMARAAAKRFNHYFGETLKEPSELVRDEVATVPGIDGRKMSKSYQNGIEPYASPKDLKKQVMSIVTDSKGLEDKKDPAGDTIVSLYKLFADSEKVKRMEDNYRAGGYGYGHAKIALLDELEAFFGPKRKEYDRIIKDDAYIEEIFQKGAAMARPRASRVLDRVRKACGIK